MTIDIYKSKGFARFARRERIGDDLLCQAVDRAERGLVDADLGGGVVKQRVPRPGKGRSNGYRTLILYRTMHRAIFVDGFAKKDADNIDDADLDRLRELAENFLDFDNADIAKLLDAGAWIEVICSG